MQGRGSPFQNAFEMLMVVPARKGMLGPEPRHVAAPEQYDAPVSRPAFEGKVRWIRDICSPFIDGRTRGAVE